jgi:hypothetical protein
MSEERAELLEQLLVALKAWEKTKTNVSYQPVKELIEKLDGLEK